MRAKLAQPEARALRSRLPNANQCKLLYQEPGDSLSGFLELDLQLAPERRFLLLIILLSESLKSLLACCRSLAQMAADLARLLPVRLQECKLG